MKRWFTALGALAVVVTNAKCAPVVAPAGPPEGAGGGGSSGPTGSTGSAGGGEATTGVAILAKDLPPAPSGPGGTMLPTVTQFVGNVDPDTLVLLFSDQALSCADPVVGTSCPDAIVWQSALLLPPDLVRVGPVDLANPRISSFSFLFAGSSGTCGGGGGGGGGGPNGPGTLNITSSDSGSITVDLVTPLLATSGGTFNGVPVPETTFTGTFTLTRCEAAPAPPPPNPAVAIRGADLPAGLNSPTIGATPDPTALYVFLGSGTETCADPMAALGCDGAGRIVLKIPAALQQPGTMDLSNPELATSVEIAGDDGSPSCGTSVGSTFSQGTLTVASIDAGGISLTLYQTLTASSSGPDFDADGLYQATICP
jgi:hypothetical protein